MNDEETIPVSVETARQLAKLQSQMVEHLKVLADPDRLEQVRTIIVQQALMCNCLEKLSNTLERTSEMLEKTEERRKQATWSLLKIPIVVCIIGASSWMFTMHEISETTWLVITGVAVFPWMGESITAIVKIFGLGRSNNGEKK